MTFRTRTFFGAMLAAALAVATGTWFSERAVRASLYEDVRQSLLTEARLAAVFLAQRPEIGDPDEEADALGARIQSRVTFIASDGQVLGDSEVAKADLPTLENHATREEVLDAGRDGEGIAARQSQTTGVWTMYAAVRVKAGPIAYVRVALPLTAVGGARGARPPVRARGAGRGSGDRGRAGVAHVAAAQPAHPRGR